jgi:hypothetical protein
MMLGGQFAVRGPANSQKVNLDDVEQVAGTILIFARD